MKKLFFQNLLAKSAMCFVAGYSLFTTQGEASYGYNSCCGPCGQWYATIEALYWKPCHDPIAVAQKITTNISRREIFYLFGEHDAGVRARLGYEICDWFFDVSYLYWDSKNEENLSNDGTVLRPIAQRENENYVFVDSEDHFNYQNVDLRSARVLCGQGACKSFIYANARWVKIDFKQNIDALTDNDEPYFYNQHSEFNGGGIGGGIGGHYAFCRGFGIGGNLGLMAILGDTEKYRFQIHDENFGKADATLVDHEDWFHVLPAFDVRIGVDYTLCCTCFSLTAEVAYELNYYIHALRYYSTTEALPESGSNGDRIPLISIQNIGFAGPVFRLTACF